MRWLVLCGCLLLSVGACGATAPSPLPTSSSAVLTIPSNGTIPTGVPRAQSSPFILITPTPDAAWPPCASPVEQPIDLPVNFAPDFPLPTGAKLLRFFTLRNDTHVQLQIIGVVPLNLHDSTQYIKSELPKAGYLITASDAEATESEGLFKGNGWIGSYRVNLIDGCDVATTWVIRVLKL